MRHSPSSMNDFRSRRGRKRLAFDRDARPVGAQLDVRDRFARLGSWWLDRRLACGRVLPGCWAEAGAVRISALWSRQEGSALARAHVGSTLVAAGVGIVAAAGWIDGDKAG